MNLNVRKVHIVVASKLNEEQEENSNISFGISGIPKDKEEFYFSRCPSNIVKGKPYLPTKHCNTTFLIVFRNRKKDNGFYKGSAFQNGKISKEISTIEGDLCKHHYYIEYIGRCYDNVKVKPYFEH